jgi:hypothetical protein
MHHTILLMTTISLLPSVRVPFSIYLVFFLFFSFFFFQWPNFGVTTPKPPSNLPKSFFPILCNNTLEKLFTMHYKKMDVAGKKNNTATIFALISPFTVTLPSHIRVFFFHKSHPFCGFIVQKATCENLVPHDKRFGYYFYLRMIFKLA